MFPRDIGGGAERTAARIPGLAGPSRILGSQKISDGNDKKGGMEKKVLSANLRPKGSCYCYAGLSTL